MKKEIIETKKELKECPFCHKPAILFREEMWNESHGYYGRYNYYVECSNNECGVKPKTREVHDVYTDFRDAIQEAIKRWNER